VRADATPTHQPIWERSLLPGESLEGSRSPGGVSADSDSGDASFITASAASVRARITPDRSRRPNPAPGRSRPHAAFTHNHLAPRPTRAHLSHVPCRSRHAELAIRIAHAARLHTHIGEQPLRLLAVGRPPFRRTLVRAVPTCTVRGRPPPSSVCTNQSGRGGWCATHWPRSSSAAIQRGVWARCCSWTR
jgi:hypothetical protein